MEDNNVNMTEGNPLKLIIIFAIPMMIGNIFQQFYNLIDSVVVGRFVNGEALAAIGSTNSITFLFFALCNGIASGGGIVTSQCFGQGDREKVKRCITNTAYIMILFPLIVGTIAFFLAKPLLLLLDTKDFLMADALIYTRYMCLGMVFVSLYNYVSSVLRALGDSKTPLYFLIFSCILNAGLDVLFVKGFSMGVTGAAVATLIAQFLSGILCLVYACKKNPYFQLVKKDFAFDRKVILSSIRLGIPLSLQFSMIAVSCMALQKVVNRFSDSAVTAFTATSRFEQVIHQPYQTIGAALATYSGQNFGAGKKERIRIGYRKCLLLMFFFSLLMLPVMQLFGKQIIGLFVKETDVIEMGARALQISSLFYVFLGTIYVVRGVLNGIGDAFFSLLNGIVEVIGRFTVPIFLTGIDSIGVWGIWWSVGIVWFLSGFTAWLRYLSFSRKAGL